MNKEKLLQFISEAIDNGAKIEVMFYGINTPIQQAREVSHQFAGIVEGNVEEVFHEGSYWYKVRTNQFHLDHFYRKCDQYMHEDVDLSGGVEDATA